MLSKHHWCILWNKHLGAQEGNLSLVSKFPWQFSLKITRTLLFCQLSGNATQDSLSFIPCSKETTAFEMFEHWCILVQLWEKGRFFHTCTSGQGIFNKDTKTVITMQQLCDLEWKLQLLCLVLYIWRLKWHLISYCSLTKQLLYGTQISSFLKTNSNVQSLLDLKILYTYFQHIAPLYHCHSFCTNLLAI